MIGLPNRTNVPYNLQDVVNIQCAALPSNCAQPTQSLQALLDGLTPTPTEVSVTSFIRTSLEE